MTISPTRAAWIALTLAAAWIPLACSEDAATPPPPPLVEQTIGASGGTVDVPGTGLQLVFPAGAVGADVQVSVSSATRSPSGVVGQAFELGPDGLSFAVPVDFRFQYEAADVSGSVLPDDLRLLTWNGSGWEEVEGVELEASSSSSSGVVRAPLEHFSTYAVANVDGADALLGTYGTAPDDVFALGTGTDGAGRMARWDGAAVGTVRTLPGGRFLDGWASGANDHYALGYDGMGRVYTSGDGANWVEATTHAQALLSIHGVGNERIAVGYDQTILEFDGSTWSDASIASLLPGLSRRKIFRGVAMTAPGEAFLVGDDVLMQRTGGAWNVVDLGALFVDRFSLRSIWARAADDVYVAGWEFLAGVGNRGVVLHYDGSAWSREIVIGAPNLRGVAAGSTFVYAVGNDGTLWKKDGGWALESTTTTATLYDVWCENDTTLAFVGAEGVFHYPGLTTGGGGGSGECTGVPSVVLDFTTGVGVHPCDTPWVQQGFPMEIRAQRPNQLLECNTAASQGLCSGNEDRTEFGPGWTEMWFSSCDRVVIDLTSQASSLGCVEIDVLDYCDDCNGDFTSGTVAYLYAADGSFLDVAGTFPQQGEDLKTLTLDGSLGQAATLEICFSYGGLYEIRFWFD